MSCIAVNEMGITSQCYLPPDTSEHTPSMMACVHLCQAAVKGRV